MTAALASNVVPMKEPTFDDFWNEVPPEKRIDKAMCRAKFEMITGPAGMRTRNLDKDSGEYISVHLQAAPSQIIKGWRRYLQEMATPDTKWGPTNKMKFKDGGLYVRRPATFLNRGGWDE